MSTSDLESSEPIPLSWIVLFLLLTIGGAYLAISFVGGTVLP